MNSLWMDSSLERAVMARAIVLGAAALIASTATPTSAQSDGLVISQVYGGGAVAGSTFNRDYIELFNRGATAIAINGWSLQSQLSGSSAWSNSLALPAASIEPGRYFLIGVGVTGAGAGAGLPLPAVDGQSSAFNLAAGTGKIALVSGIRPTPDGICRDATIIDLVQYGSSAVTCAEGNPADGLSITTAALRKSSGCQDSDNNAGDFEIVAPMPRNSAAPVHLCGEPPSCTADIVHNNAVDVDDMLAVIRDWGPCHSGSPPPPCPANIVITGGSANQVDIADLLAVIISWGACR